jgi:glycosyltransferase involved in cell wall biosynthesis
MSKEKTKIMTMTDASLKTGFGLVMHNISVGLADNGFDVYFLGWGFRHDEAIPRANYQLLPTGNHQFGGDALPQYIQQIRPEVLITQTDTRMIDWLPNLLKQVPHRPDWILYPVIDGHVWDVENKRTKWPSNWTNIIKQADVVVGMTQWGQNILKQNGVDAKYIPHGVDTTLFRPYTNDQKGELKKNAGLQGKFVVGGVFKNILRKNPEKYLHAFSLFRKGREDKVVLLLHAPPNRETGGEYDLVQQAIDIGLTIGKDLVFSSMGAPTQWMPNLFNIMDVFWTLGGMESYCLPLVEAMACGIPTVALNGTTFPEILADTGILSDVPTYPGSKDTPVTYGSYNGVEGLVCNPYDVAKKTETLYEDKQLRERISYKEVERAVTVYDWAIVRKQWVELVKSCIITPEQLPEEWKQLYEQTK